MLRRDRLEDNDSVELVVHDPFLRNAACDSSLHAGPEVDHGDVICVLIACIYNEQRDPTRADLSRE